MGGSVLASVRYALLLGGAVFFLLLLMPGTARAQQPPSAYLFVEVRDAAGNALADAAVQLSAADGKQILGEKTDKSGAVRARFFAVYERYYDLRVSKAGYQPSEHVLHLSPDSVEEIPPALWGAGASRESPIKLVLARNPATAAERRAAEIEERKRRLLLAAKRGDAANVRKLLGAGVSANVANAKGVPAIAWAALAGDPETIQALLAAGADVGEGNQLGHQALLIYLSEGIQREWGVTQRRGYLDAVSGRRLLERREETVRRLIAAGAAVDVENSPRGTVLNNAIGYTMAYYNPPEILSAEIIKSLIAAGADVNAADTYGKTALMLAAERSSAELVRMLLEAKASVNVKDKQWGFTPLIYALHSYDAAHTAVVKALLAAGADVDAADEEGRTTLMLAASNVLAVRTLLGAGASAKDKLGQTVLMHACRSYPTVDLTLFLRAGAAASVNAKDVRGWTALMHCAAGDIEAPGKVEALVAAGADVNATNRDGWNALMMAEGKGHGETVKRLIRAGAQRR
jgi:uncharacterized protein